MPEPDPEPGPHTSAFRRFLAAVVASFQGQATSDRPRPPERRRAPRLAARPGVRAAVRLAPDDGTDVGLALVDVSADGAGLRLRTPVRPGEETYLDLLLPAGADPVRRRAAVVWCRPESGSSFRAGVRFASQLTADDLRILAN